MRGRSRTGNAFVRGLVVAAGIWTIFSLGAGAGAEERSDDGLWRSLRVASKPDGAGDAWLEPVHYRAFLLDPEQVQGTIDVAPVEPSPGVAPEPGTEAVLMLPLPSGGYERFAVWRTVLFEPELAARFPEILTFQGRGLDDPAKSLVGDWTPLGFHGMVFSPDGDFTIDPIWKGDVTTYACARKSDAARRAEPAVCTQTDFNFNALQLPPGGAALTSGTNLRNYRLAVACTGEYTAFFGGTQALALAALATMLTRLNGVYQREVAIRMTLVATETNVIFTNGGADPFTTDGGGNLTNPNAEAQAAIDVAPPGGIGNANYDIGHLVHSIGGGGNAGGIGTVCQAGIKGSGFTALNPPTGDAYWIDFVAHEMGHQFGGNHTWASCVAQFDEDNPVKFEPGSGTTIMAYAGICGADDVPNQPQPDPGAQPPVGFSDPYFHAGSLDQIVAYTTTPPGNCPAPTATGNATPSAGVVGGPFTIPQETPFVLTATGSDSDGGTVTFCWEEMDGVPNGADPLLSAVDNGTAPLFRSYPPTTSPDRTFPRLADLAAGDVFPTLLGEQLPSTIRTMNFRVTVRDNQTPTGAVQTADTTVTTTGDGPFEVITPNGGESWGEGTSQTVTWNVANSDIAPVSTANVQITMSLDAGLTYPITLLASTPNDGSESVTLPPCNLTTTARIRVAAVGNIFFDISDADFSIVDTTPPTVVCSVGRSVLWPASKGLLDVLLTHAALDNCTAPALDTIRVHSDEGNGALPYSPDATLVGPTMRLRAERAIPGNGRCYLVVVQYVDAALNPARDVCTAVVPAQLTVSSISAVLLEASVFRANCLAGGGLPPAGTVQILP